MLRRSFAILLLTTLLCWSSAAFGRNLTYRFPKDQVTAAYLYNFALFSQWPESVFDGRSHFVIATFDQSFADLAAETLAGRKAGTRPIKVCFIQSLEETTGVQILLLSEDERSQLTQILTHLKQQPVLTVGLLPDFTSSGGMIELFTVDRRLRFAINLAAVKTSKLKISSEVLRLADRVEGDGRLEVLE